MCAYIYIRVKEDTGTFIVSFLFSFELLKVLQEHIILFDNMASFQDSQVKDLFPLPLSGLYSQAPLG